MNTSISFEVVPVSRLSRLPNNAKIHTDEQIDQLRASIRKFGFNDPIGVDQNYVIIEGDGRFQAALAEGMEEVPVVRLSHLSERERDAYAIAHNQTQLSTGLDVNNIQSEMARLHVAEDEFAALGFSETDTLFIGFTEPMGPEAVNDEDHAESKEWQDLIQPIVKTTLKFGHGDAYVRFNQLVDALAAKYPDTPRVADRLLRVVKDARGDAPL